MVMLHGTWILVPQPGIKPITLQWKHGALPTCTGCKWRAGDWQQEAALTPQPAQHPRPTQHPHPAQHPRDPHCVNRQEGVSLPLTASEGTRAAPPVSPQEKMTHSRQRMRRHESLFSVHSLNTHITTPGQLGQVPQVAGTQRRGPKGPPGGHSNTHTGRPLSHGTCYNNKARERSKDPNGPQWSTSNKPPPSRPGRKTEGLQTGLLWPLVTQFVENKPMCDL